MLQAICITFLVGIAFGLSLLLTQKVLFFSKKPMAIGAISMLRLCMLGRFFYIMLKSTQIHPIILVASFLIAYWLTILKFKEYMHAGS
jgi:hypothetical protein